MNYLTTCLCTDFATELPSCSDEMAPSILISFQPAVGSKGPGSSIPKTFATRIQNWDKSAHPRNSKGYSDQS